MIYEHGLEPNNKAYHQLIYRYVSDGQLEMSLRILGDMSSRAVVPTLASVQGVIKLACTYGLAKLATEIACDFEEAGVRRLENEGWIDCLAACAEDYWVITSISLLIG